MNATIKIYSKSKQTKGKGADKVTSIAERTIDVLTYSLKGNSKLKDKLAQIEHFVTRAIGARYEAFLSLGKRMPSTIYFEVSLEGRVFRSETALVRANMLNAVAVSMKGLLGKDGDTVINEVAATQIRGIRTSVTYLNRIAQIAKESEGIAKLTAKETPALSFMTSADLLELEPVVGEVVTS